LLLNDFDPDRHQQCLSLDVNDERLRLILPGV
jgi:hypothetical protein